MFGEAGRFRVTLLACFVKYINVSFFFITETVRRRYRNSQKTRLRVLLITLGTHMRVNTDSDSFKQGEYNYVIFGVL